MTWVLNRCQDTQTGVGASKQVSEMKGRLGMDMRFRSFDGALAFEWGIEGLVEGSISERIKGTRSGVFLRLNCDSTGDS